jgi:hypothetical protein
VADEIDGEIPPDAPSYGEALRMIEALETEKRMMERDLSGKRLAIARLEADREAAALASPYRRQVDVVHAVWKVACRRRRDLDFMDRENIERVLRHRKMGFTYALTCVAGAMLDPATKELRNGRVQRFDDLELIFRNLGKARSFHERAPVGWEPDPEKIAKIADVDPDWVRGLCQNGTARSTR